MSDASIYKCLNCETLVSPDGLAAPNHECNVCQGKSWVFVGYID